MKIIRFLSLLLILILPVSVRALTGKISVSCTPEEVKKGNEVTCTIKGTSSSEGILQYKAKLFIGEGLTYKDVREEGDSEPKYYVQLNSWQGEGDLSDNNIDGYRENPTGESFNLGKFTVIVDANASAGNISINVSDVEYCYDDTCVSIDSTSTAINVVEDETPLEPEVNPELKNLTVTSGGDLNKTFSKDESNYIVTLDSSDTTKFAISAVAENSDDTIIAKNTDTGESIDLKSDIVYKPKEDSSTMSITITVSSNDKSKDYVIIVTRPKPKEIGQPVLSSLVVGGVNVNLKSGKYDYEVTLSADVLKSYLVNALLEDEENFKVHDISVLAPNELSGEQEFEIRIIPKDSNSGYGSNTYVIRVVKSGDSSQDPSTPTPDPGAGGDVPNNPSTGNGSAIVMAIVLVLSFAASIYYYKKNISNFN